MRTRIAELGLLPSLLVASLSAWIIALGAPPNGWLAGPWLGYVPLILMVRRTRVSWRQAALFGLAGGMGIGLGGFPWIAEMLVNFARVPVPVGFLGLLFFSAWMAIPYAIWALGLRIGPFDGWRGLAWPIALFVSLQSFWPVLFPYTPVLGFAERPELMQLAEIAGVHIIEALVILAALCLANAITASSSAVRLRQLAIGLAIPLLVFLYGSWRMQAMDAQAEGAPTLRVGVVQPNVPVGRLPAAIKMDRLQRSSARAERLGADLVIWPEAGAYPYGIARPFRHDRELGRARVMSQHRVPTIFGANSRVPEERFGYNSVYHMDADGSVLGAYDKFNLVPLGEYIPIIDPDWVTNRIPEIGHHQRGERLGRFLVEASRDGRDGGRSRRVSVGPLICYEDIIPSFVRDLARMEGGVELFVNLTIDAWYGDSAEPWEHLALSQFRSVEHRIPMVRSVSTGVSAVIDYNGRLTAHLPHRPVSVATLAQYPPEILVESVPLPRNTATEPTFYARYGWAFPHLCQLAVLIAVGMEYARRRRKVLSPPRILPPPGPRRSTP